MQRARKFSNEALQRFDTDGNPLQFGNVKLTAKHNKTYQTPYGGVNIKRHIYQTTKGGKTYCPLDDRAHRGATPRFAKQISHKYSNMNAPSVCADLQEVTNWVGSIAQAKTMEI